MILYYAMGGGLGHLSRAHSVLYTLGLESEAIILTASPDAADARICGSLRVAHVLPQLAHNLPTYRDWLAKLFDELRPAALYLDTFPAGIRGELCDFSPVETLPVNCIARLLKWQEYAKVLNGSPPRLDSTYILEPLTDEHTAFIHGHSARYAPLEIKDPPHMVDEKARALMLEFRRIGRPIWLIVHSGPAEEILELVAYAEELRRIEREDAQIVLIAREVPPELPPEVQYVDFYPASLLFPLAARIISACGFNIVRETKAHRARHCFMPFARRFDDQFMRAARLQQQSTSR